MMRLFGNVCSEADITCNISRGWAVVRSHNDNCQYDYTTDDKVCR